MFLQSDAMALLWRRRWVICLVFLATTAVHFLLFYSRTPQFEAESILRLRPHEASTVQAGGVQGLSLYDSFGLPVIRQLILDPSYDQEVRERLRATDPSLLSSWNRGDLNLSLVEETDGSFLSFRLSTKRSGHALPLLEAAVGTLIDHSKRHFEAGVQSGRARLQRKLAGSEEQLRLLQDSIRQLRSRAQLPPDAEGVNTYRTALLESLAALELRQVEVEGELVEVTHQLKRISDRLIPSQQSPDLSAWLLRLEGTPAMPLVEAVVSRLIEAELSLVRLQGAYSMRHPEVQEAESQLEVTERAFSALFDGESPTGQYLRAALSRATSTAEDQIWSHEAKRISLERRLRALSDLHEDKQSRLAHLRAFEGDRLERDNARLDLRALCAELQRSERDLDLLTHLTPEVMQVFRSPTKIDPIRRRPENVGSLILLFAVILSVGAGYLVDWIDPRIRDVPGLRRRSGVPCLAVLPRFRSGQIDQLESESSGRSLEAFHGLASQVCVRLGGQRVLLVTGTDEGVGTSFVSEHLARASARLGLRTLLIDGELASPVQHLRFGLPVAPGLSDWIYENLEDRSQALHSSLRSLRDEAEPQTLRLRPEELPALQDGGLQRVAPAGSIATVVRPTRFERLSVVPAGGRVEHPGSLLGSGRMGRFLEEARQQYPMIVVDTSSLARTANAQLLSRGVDGVLLVARTGKTPGAGLSSDVQALLSVEAPLMGTVLNGCDQSLRLRTAGIEEPKEVSRAYA